MFDPFSKEVDDLPIGQLIDFFKVPTLSIQDLDIKKNLHSIPYSYCKKNELLPIEKTQHGFVVATTKPFQNQIAQELSFMLGADVDFCYCPQKELLELIDRFFHQEKSATSKMIRKLADKPQDATDTTYDLLDDPKTNAPSIRLLNSIIGEAITQAASDIHFEPVEETFRIRYRIDGVLQNRHKIPSHYKSHITSRLKLMAKLDIAETRRP